MSRPWIGITVGDPAGIGPEITVRAARRPEVLAVCKPVLIGAESTLQRWAQPNIIPALAVPRPGIPLSFPDGEFPVILPAISDEEVAGIEFGVEQAAGGRAAAAAIELGVTHCLAGSLAALVTAPLSKRSLALAGIKFPGHTEYLAFLTGCDDFAMAFFAPRLRVALLTTHVALGDVPGLVRRPALVKLIRLVDRELKRYGIARPRLALAAINPHAGEGGLFGEEEIREMIPAVEEARMAGIDVTGPHPGDTVFVRAVKGEFDLVISCYHDQGLIPIKCYSFGEAVNVTFGLPIIRTSVDHGTAFDIAGEGVADESSLVAAILLAVDLVGRRRGSIH